VRNIPSPSQVKKSWIGALALFAGIMEPKASPVIPGLHANHPLDEAQVGAVLIEELRCASCHEGISASQPPSAPDLIHVGSRLNPDFIRSFIEAPQTHDPGTAMPDLLGDRDDKERKEIAASITAYLLSLETDEATPAPAPAKEGESASELYHEAGCVACHAPLDQKDASAHTGAVGLAHVGKKYRPGGLTAFLQEPLITRPDGRMPDMKLSKREAELLSIFLIGDSATEQKTEANDGAVIAAGKKAFSEMRCASCHDVGGSPSPALPLTKLDPDKGCLSKSPGDAPNYGLSEGQRAAIRKALAAKPAKPEPADAIKMRLTQLNCISCHQRDEYGGVSQELDSYFHSTEEALGNEARLPPPLTLTGAKLRPEWMRKVLYESESVRPYMTTRMPQYGSQALDGLAGLFETTDKLEPFDFPPIEQKANREMRDAATTLLGDKGLACIACHNFNGKDSPGMKGLDIMTSYQRLQPAWFNKFMRNPAELRPGIIMPSYWPGGKAAQTEILGGDTDAQIAALWLNFSLGRSARDPSGLRTEDPELTVGDNAVTYRGRSNVAGYRGIAVGFPGGMNYAFNAQNGAISAIWKGRFVKVGWTGQGSGNFTPAERSIQLAQDVAFLAEAPEPWPLAPQRTKENPVNPDPLYPRQHGYAFQGYSISENGIPTFRYKSGDIGIEDTTFPFGDNSRTFLRRNLSFQTDKATNIHFRVLTGKIDNVSATVFKNEDLQVTLGDGSARVKPQVRQSSGGELILTIGLPAGTSNLTIDYAPLR
jgi:cytochrome c2